MGEQSSNFVQLIVIIIIIGIIGNTIANIFFVGKKVLRKKSKKSYNQKTSDDENIEHDSWINYNGYRKKLLLTKNEYYFYKRLKTALNGKDVDILAKIRLADLIDPIAKPHTSEWHSLFARIKAKHIDFAVADNMKIILLIELDDNSHSQKSRVKRDEFVDTILTNAGYQVARTYGRTDEIEQIINVYLSASRPQNQTVPPQISPQNSAPPPANL